MIQDIKQGRTDRPAGPVGARRPPKIALRDRIESQLLAYAKAAAVSDLDLKALLARALPAGAISLGLLGGADVASAGTIVSLKQTSSSSRCAF